MNPNQGRAQPSFRPMQDIGPRRAAPSVDGFAASTPSMTPVQQAAPAQDFSSISPEPVQQQPSTSQVANPIAAAPNNLNVQPVHDPALDQMMHEANQSMGQHAVQQAPMTHQKRSKKPVLIIALALIVAAGLGVAAFFAFRPETDLLNDKSPSASSPQSESAQNSNSSTQAASSNQQTIDDTVKTIDQSNSLDDTKDFASEDLSDKALGIQ